MVWEQKTAFCEQCSVSGKRLVGREDNDQALIQELIQADKKAAITQIAALYNYGEQQQQKSV